VPAPRHRLGRRSAVTYNSGMNVMGVGPLELAVIIVVALLVVGPERLPRLMADVARTIREIRRYTGRLASEFNEVVQELEREAETPKTAWKEIGEGLAGAKDVASRAAADVRRETSALPAAATGAAASHGGSRASNGAWVDVPEPPAPGQLADAPPAREASR
jgi:sec-independent protein translocase protein TatB